MGRRSRGRGEKSRKKSRKKEQRRLALWDTKRRPYIGVADARDVVQLRAQLGVPFACARNKRVRPCNAGQQRGGSGLPLGTCDKEARGIAAGKGAVLGHAFGAVEPLAVCDIKHLGNAWSREMRLRGRCNRGCRGDGAATAPAHLSENGEEDAHARLCAIVLGQLAFAKDALLKRLRALEKLRERAADS